MVPGRSGVKQLLIAPAASNQTANFLRNTLGQPTDGNVPRVVDVVPLPSDDSAGSSIGLLLQVLILGGTIGVIGMASLVLGAGVTLLRNVFYFPDASVAKSITILAIYVGVGSLVLIALKVLDARRGREPRAA